MSEVSVTIDEALGARSDLLTMSRAASLSIHATEQNKLTLNVLVKARSDAMTAFIGKPVTLKAGLVFEMESQGGRGWKPEYTLTAPDNPDKPYEVNGFFGGLTVLDTKDSVPDTGNDDIIMEVPEFSRIEVCIAIGETATPDMEPDMQEFLIPLGHIVENSLGLREKALSES